MEHSDIDKECLRAEAALAGKDYKGALPHLNAVIVEKRHSLSRYYCRRGHALLVLGDWDEAVGDADEAIQLDGANEIAYRVKGEALRKLGILDEALEAFEQSRDLAPNEQQPVEGLVKVKGDMGDKDRKKNNFCLAAMHYTEGLRLCAESRLNNWMCSLHYGRGLCRIGMEQPLLALEDFEEAEKLQLANLPPGESHPLHHHKSQVLCGLGRYSDALQSAEETIRLKPTWPEGHRAKAEALRGLAKGAQRSAATVENALTVSRLPTELWEMIFEQCSDKDVRQVALVCKLWRAFASHLRFRNVRLQLWPQRHGNMESVQDAFLEWMVAHPRALHAVWSISLIVGYVYDDDFETKHTVKSFLLSLPNVQELSVIVDDDEPYLGWSALRSLEISSAVLNWPQLQKADVAWRGPERIVTVFDRSETPGEIPASSIGIEGIDDNPTDFAAIALHLLECNAASLSKPVPTLRFRYSCDILTCDLMSDILDTTVHGLNIVLYSSTKVCCQGGLEQRAVLAAREKVLFAGELAAREQASYTDLSKYALDWEGGDSEEAESEEAGGAQGAEVGTEGDDGGAAGSDAAVDAAVAMAAPLLAGSAADATNSPGLPAA